MRAILPYLPPVAAGISIVAGLVKLYGGALQVRAAKRKARR